MDLLLDWVERQVDLIDHLRPTGLPILDLPGLREVPRQL